MAQILLIEPDVNLAKSYAGALGRAGHKLIISSSAQSAVDACDRVLPDVILLELLLANHNGIEFLYELRSYPEWQSIPVIILSSIPPVEFDSHSILWEDLAVSSYLYKPKATLSRIVGSVENIVSISA